MKEYMAYNHNGTPLMNQPGTRQQADKEAAEYRHQTGNAAYVDVIDAPQLARKPEVLVDPAQYPKAPRGDECFVELEAAMKQMTADEIGRWFIDYMLESANQGFDGFSRQDMSGIRNLVRDMLLHRFSILKDQPDYFSSKWSNGSHSW